MASVAWEFASRAMNALGVLGILGGMASGGYSYYNQQQSACDSVSGAYDQMGKMNEAAKKAMGALSKIDQQITGQMHDIAVGLAHNYREMSDIADRGRTLLTTLQIALGSMLAIVCVLLVMKRMHLLRLNPFLTEEEAEADKRRRREEKARAALDKKLRREKDEDGGGALGRAILADPRFARRARDDPAFVQRLLDDEYQERLRSEAALGTEGTFGTEGTSGGPARLRRAVELAFAPASPERVA